MSVTSDFIRDSGIEALASLGVSVERHESLPLAILNYSQFDSPKLHPVVRECRGLVVHVETFDVVARAFPRFFNWGEITDEMGNFDFSDFTVQEKVDGSLCLLYFFDGQWRLNTRGSWAEGLMQGAVVEWKEAFLRGWTVESLNDHAAEMNSDVTYVCELCSPWNKVVREYKQPEVYLLSAFFRNGDELSAAWCDDSAALIGMIRPPHFQLHSIDEIRTFLTERSQSDPTFEGVVIRDMHDRRWKIKSPSYLALHKLQNNGALSKWDLVPMILSGETDELLTYFGEFSGIVTELQFAMDTELSRIVALWEQTKRTDSQKDFALSIIGKTPFTAVLFQARKTGRSPVEVWRESGDLIAKVLDREMSPK